MITDGLSITVIGMLIVFGFLIILVLAMMFLNYILRKFFPKALEEPVEEAKAGTRTDMPSKAAAGKDELAEVAAAIAAIQNHIAMNRG